MSEHQAEAVENGFRPMLGCSSRSAYLWNLSTASFNAAKKIVAAVVVITLFGYLPIIIA